MDDDEAIALTHAAQAGDSVAMETLLREFIPMLRRIAKQFRFPGSDFEDSMQEALLGAASAIQSFQPCNGATVKAFVRFVARRRLISALNGARRKKHGALNSAISLDAPLYEDGGAPVTTADILRDPTGIDPLRYMENNELAAGVRKAIVRGLTPYECAVCLAYMQGCSYQQIAVRLGISTKSCDNAMQRIKVKVCANIREQLLTVAAS